MTEIVRRLTVSRLVQSQTQNKTQNGNYENYKKLRSTTQ